MKPLIYRGNLSGSLGGVRLADARVPGGPTGCALFFTQRSTSVYAMAHQSLDGRFRISPVDCRGRAITPEVLSAAHEISGRALSHAEKVLNDPAVAFSAFEETAATVSRMLSKRRGSGNIRNLPGYLFRAFLRLADSFGCRQGRFYVRETDDFGTENELGNR